ncbi:hypothetical protein LCGC14_3026210, partial [marine sediment metagenome]
MFTGIDSFPLMAIPLFILAGNLMSAGGISQRLVELAKSLVGGIQGGLACTCVLTCMLFASVSGSSVATTFAIGAILIPAMVKHWQDVLLLLPDQYPHLISEEQLKELLGKASLEVAGMANRLVSFSFSTFPSLVAMMVYLVLVPLLVFFMLKDKDELLEMMSGLLPQERPVMWQIWHEMNVQVANYVRGKAIEILLVGFVSYAAFLIMGLNYAALLALLVGLSVVIPYIGAVVVTIPVTVVAYFQWGWGGDLFWLVMIYGIIQGLDGNVLVPLLFSEAVNLHPIAIILAVLVFGGLWGFWGIFFAIPLATLVKALYNAWPRTDLSNSVSE